MVGLREGLLVGAVGICLLLLDGFFLGCEEGDGPDMTVHADVVIVLATLVFASMALIFFARSFLLNLPRPPNSIVLGPLDSGSLSSFGGAALLAMFE